MKKIRVRKAKIRDLGLFRKLINQFLNEHYKLGSLIEPSKRNIEIFENLFKYYIENKDSGIVLFVADRGLLMWGSDGVDGLDIKLGKKVAQAWLTYVIEEYRNKGLSKTMQAEAKKELKEKGFTAILTSSLDDEISLKNLVNQGFKKHSILMYCNLNDKG